MSMEFSSRPHLANNRLLVLNELILVFSKDEHENDSYVNWWEDLNEGGAEQKETEGGTIMTEQSVRLKTFQSAHKFDLVFLFMIDNK